MEESGRRESFAPTYGVHINPVSKGKQIPFCSSGQGCTHEGGPFQRPPIDCTDLNYRTLKTLFSIHHQHHSYTVGPNDKTRPKIREINWSSLCLQQFDKFWIWSACNDRKRKLCESTETCFEKFVKSLQAKLFLVGAILKLCAALWQLLYWSQYRKIYYGFCRKLIKNCSAVLIWKNIFSDVWNKN